MLVDSFGRVHNYLRISLTNNCNLRCFYCMPEEDYTHTPAAQLMQADEIAALAQLFVNLGVNKIRLTGGEPLVRKDAPAIIASLGKLPSSLTITSNGVRMHECFPILREAGIRSVNISLDTLDEEKFLLLTRRNQFQKVWQNIHLLVQEGFHVKANVVVMKGVNEHELTRFVAWTKDVPVHVRFIEFMPFSGNRWTSNRVFTWQDILDAIAADYSFVRLLDEANDTAKKYGIPGHKGTFAVISTMSAPFCATCNRMRLTADGKLKNCLFSQSETDLLTPLRRGEDVEGLIRQTILNKAAERGGQFSTRFEELQSEHIHNRSMIAIGG